MIHKAPIVVDGKVILNIGDLKTKVDIATALKLVAQRSYYLGIDGEYHPGYVPTLQETAVALTPFVEAEQARDRETGYEHNRD